MNVVTLIRLPLQVVTTPLFTGTPVFENPVFGSDASRDFVIGLVSFSAGSRNKFHTHSSDQILVVTEGTGEVATEHDHLQVRVGDVIFIPAGERHWHGAPGATAMAHLTITRSGNQTVQTET